MKETTEYLVDDEPVDISRYSDEEIEKIFKERFGEYEGEKETKIEEYL